MQAQIAILTYGFYLGNVIYGIRDFRKGVSIKAWKNRKRLQLNLQLSSVAEEPTFLTFKSLPTIISI